MEPEFFEKILIQLLFINYNARDKIYPFISTLNVSKIFDNQKHQQIIKAIITFKQTYNNFPKLNDLQLSFDDVELFQALKDIMNIDINEYNNDLIFDEIEEFFKSKLIWNELISLKNGLNSNDFNVIGSIPDNIREALSFSFDTSIGLDFINDIDRMYEYLHNKDIVISSGIKIIDEFIDGGFHEKSLFLFLAQCVTNDTIVNVRYRLKNDFEYKKMTIQEVIELYKTGKFEIELDSPDGYVGLNGFVQKDKQPIYELKIEDLCVKASALHLFETNEGWKFVKDLIGKDYEILTKNGYKKYTINKLNYDDFVYDLSVNHPNHRYYTNDISSHNTNLGKTLIQCSFAVNALLQNKNVLFISLEESEDKLSKRFLANLFDYNINELKNLNKKDFYQLHESCKDRIRNLIIKEYPGSTISANHIRSLLKELDVKKNFKPDLICIDYIGCMVPNGKMVNGNSNDILKAITEEVRALSVEYGPPILSALQTNRCLSIDSKVIIQRDRLQQTIDIGNIKINDRIQTIDGFNTVIKVYPIEEQVVYEIELENGDKIKCSEKHLFPTKNGLKSIISGLSINAFLFIKNGLFVKIKNIKKLGIEKTIDISTDGNNLFFANNILTHNSGFGNIDVDLTNTAESIGSTFKADAVFGVAQNDEHRVANIFKFKLLKSRFGDANRSFYIGVDKPKMRLFDVDITQEEQIPNVDPATSTPSSIIRKSRQPKKIEMDFDED